MRLGPISLFVVGFVATPAWSQSYTAHIPQPYTSSSSVAYDHGGYYIARLRPTREYPPSRYGYVITNGNRAGAAAYGYRGPVR